MNLELVKHIANKMINKHSNKNWSFKFDNAKRRAGLCSYRTKTISLSKEFALRNDRPIVLDTILHEIAHANIGSGNGHNKKWKAEYARLQEQENLPINPRRCYDSQKVNMPKGKFKLTCTKCHGSNYYLKRLHWFYTNEDGFIAGYCKCSRKQKTIIIEELH